MESYTYSPLSVATNQIRLLSLQPAQERSATLVCNLSNAFLDNPPPYEALSYTWGPAENHTILLRCISFKVTVNLDSALRDLRHDTLERTLWIDAICINQNDILERNHQVTKMRQIYEAASKVVVWLGGEAADSKKALKFVAGFGYRLEKAETVADAEKLIRDSFRLPRHEKAWAALANVVSRPWWTRAWTFQEIVVASNAVVHCGRQSVLWRYFFHVAFLVDRYESMFQRDEPIYPDTDRFVGKYEHLYNMALFQKQTSLGHPPLLLEALQTRRRALSTDPRDKVFALVGISKDNVQGNPIPSSGPHLQLDYSKSLVEVYKDVTRHLINKMANLDVLSACQFKRHQPGLPSWAPDWSIPRTTNPIRNRDQWGDIHYASELEASMALYSEREWEVGDAEGSNILRIQGIPVDIIENVGTPHTYGHDWNKLQSNWYNLALQCSCALADGTSIEPGDEIPADGSALYFTGQVIADAFRQTCVFSRITDLGDSDEWKWKWHIARIEAIEHRRFFVTASGFMGIGPLELESGDLVAVLQGARVLFVLRELKGEERAWEVIGEAYLHGFMKGEIKKFAGVEGLEAQEFRLK
ncbi:HET-domain-containing protein [Acephala macrosclerotiorum]|nr:HET-domain-containing protein [Acephala macrosclerotiorum]